MPARIEHRSYQTSVKLETRADGSAVIRGYAAVFYREGDPGTEFVLWDGAVERIMPKAFNRAIKEKHDVRGQFNHDPSLLLGRVSAGTMRLSKDDIGLVYEIDPADTQVARDVVTMLKRGDVTGSSFSFAVTEENWRVQKDGPEIREVKDVDLFDVGPVTWPAYESTTAGLRGDRSAGGVDDARASWDAWKADLRAAAAVVAHHARRIEIAEKFLTT